MHPGKLAYWSQHGHPTLYTFRNYIICANKVNGSTEAFISTENSTPSCSHPNRGTQVTARIIPHCQTQEHVQHPLLPLFSSSYSRCCEGRGSLSSLVLVCLDFWFFLGFQFINSAGEV